MHKTGAFTLSVLLIGLLGLTAPSLAAAFDDEIEKGRKAADQVKLEKAEKAFRKALDQAELKDDAPAWQEPVALYYLGDLYTTFPYMELADQAVPLLTRSVASWEDLAGPESPALALVLARLAQAQADAGDATGAAASLGRSKAILAGALPEGHPLVARWPASSGMVHPDEFFSLAMAQLKNAGRPKGTCTPPPAAPVTIDAEDTFVGSLIHDDQGRPVYIHATENDMPWRVAIAKPKRPPKYGSTKDAREVAIKAMRGWEEVIRPKVPWFHLEFVEAGEQAHVQVNWKRRMVGSAAGRGGPRYWTEGDCIHVGGVMDIAVRGGNEAHTHLTVAELEMLVAHEFGHVLNLVHCFDCDSAMSYAWHQRDRVYVTDLDVRTFEKLVSIPLRSVGAEPVAAPGDSDGGADGDR